jgi:ABC-type transport system involved in Fe-S cluster assembly fused permease/ATPase subunit
VAETGTHRGLIRTNGLYASLVRAYGRVPA